MHCKLSLLSLSLSLSFSLSLSLLAVWHRCFFIYLCLRSFLLSFIFLNCCIYFLKFISLPSFFYFVLFGFPTSLSPIHLNIYPSINRPSHPPTDFPSTYQAINPFLSPSVSLGLAIIYCVSLFCPSINLSNSTTFSLSLSLSVPSIHLSVYLSSYLPACLCTYLSESLCVSFYFSIHFPDFSLCVPILPIFLHLFCLPIYLSNYYLSI